MFSYLKNNPPPIPGWYHFLLKKIQYQYQLGMFKKLITCTLPAQQWFLPWYQCRCWLTQGTSSRHWQALSSKGMCRPYMCRQILGMYMVLDIPCNKLIYDLCKCEILLSVNDSQLPHCVCMCKFVYICDDLQFLDDFGKNKESKNLDCTSLLLFILFFLWYLLHITWKKIENFANFLWYSRIWTCDH